VSSPQLLLPSSALSFVFGEPQHRFRDLRQTSKAVAMAPPWGALAAGVVSGHINPPPPDRSSTVQIRSYPFGVTFAKETLSFSAFKPTVLGVIWETRFDVLKTYFRRFKSNYTS